MKLLITSDWQCTLGNLDRCTQTRDQILQILGDHVFTKLDWVLHLGDIKDLPHPDQRVTNFLVETVQKLGYTCRVGILEGNHDRILQRDGSPSIMPVLQAAGAETFSEPEFGFPLGKNMSLFAVPFIRDEAELIRAFKRAAMHAQQTKGKKILIFHNEIAGCKQSVWRTGSGPSIADVNPQAYDFCFGGHIHYPHRIGSNLRYVGSPFAVDWGEVNQEKSFTLAELYSNGDIWVDTTPSKVPRWYDPAAPEYTAPEDWTGCRVRISVPVSKDPIKELEAAKAKLSRKYPRAILHLIPSTTEIDAPNSILTTGTDEEMLAGYLKTLSLPDSENIIAYLKPLLTSVGVGVEGVRFERAWGQNTLSFEKAGIDLSAPGLTLITAENRDRNRCSNGGGKSNFLSLPWIALFGMTLKRQKHDHWACRHNKETAKASVSFRLPDNRLCVVTRQRRPSGFTLHLDGTEVSLGTPEKTQEYLEKLTGLTWDVLTNSIYIGQNEIGSVFGTDKQRKELFSRLLGLERFILTQERLNKKLRRIKDLISESGADIAAAEAALEESKSGLAELQNTIQTQSSVAVPDPATFQLEIDTLQKAVEGVRTQIDALRAKEEKAQRRYQELLNKSAVAESSIAALNSQISVKERLLRSTKTQACPTCGNAITPDVVRSCINALIRQRDAAHKELDEKILVEQEAVQTVFTRASKAAQKLGLEHTALRYRIIEKEQEKRSAESRLTIQKNLIASLEHNLETKRSRCDMLQSRVSVHVQYRSDLLDWKAFLELCIKVVGRDGLPAYLCSVVAPQLNAAAAKYSQLFSEGSIGLRFVMENGDIDVTIDNATGGTAIEDQSWGETRIAALIAVFSFHDVLVRHGLLILDEPGEGLDEVSAIAFARGLMQIKDDLGSTFLVTHNPAILSELNADRIIEIIKERGLSRVL